MPLTKQQKAVIIDEVSQLLASSKMTVMASYPGTSVKAMQQLRREARMGGTDVRVVKNRLFIKALESNDKFNSIDKNVLKGQLLYAFNAADEVAPAQSLASFAKIEPQLQFVGAITDEGQLLAAEDVKALASLPAKDQLRAQLIGTISAPVGGLVNVVAANLRGVMNVLTARAETAS